MIRLGVFALLTGACAVSACLNETGINRHGQRVQLNSHSAVDWRTSVDDWPKSANQVKWARDVIAKARKEPDPDNLNDLSVVLIELGNPAKAVELLKFIERIEPGRYATATNLGTAYELLGDNKLALQWIREGIRRYPYSHGGSEWLHVRILESKISPLEVPPGQSILRLDFGSNLVPRRPANLPSGNNSKVLGVHDLAWGIGAQLRERVPLVTPKDAIVAGLFLDWGNLQFADGSLEMAAMAYDMASRYGAEQTGLLVARKKEVARILMATSGKDLPNGKCEVCESPRE